MKKLFKRLVSFLFESPVVPFILFVFYVQQVYHIFDYNGSGYVDKLSICLESGDSFYQFFAGCALVSGGLIFMFVLLFWDSICFLAKSIFSLLCEWRQEKKESCKEFSE